MFADNPSITTHGAQTPKRARGRLSGVADTCQVVPSSEGRCFLADGPRVGRPARPKRRSGARRR